MKNAIFRDHGNYHSENRGGERTTAVALGVRSKFLFIHPRGGIDDSHFCKMSLAKFRKQRIWLGRNPANSCSGRTITCSRSLALYFLFCICPDASNQAQRVLRGSLSGHKQPLTDIGPITLSLRATDSPSVSGDLECRITFVLMNIVNI